MPSIGNLYRLGADYFRPRRMRQFARTFNLSTSTRVLDVGGTPHVWAYLPVRPRLTLLNLGPRPADLDSTVEWVQGTALDLPFGPGRFDIVFSNSVVEHVGDWNAQQRFAAEVRRLGASYYVQTPNRNFPIEPHVLGLGVQWMSRPIARVATRYATAWGLLERPTARQVDEMLDGIRLLTAREMGILFPEARIVTERALGLAKSFTAIRTVWK